MKKFIKSSTILQVVVATFVTILATAGIVAATTTISTNISTAGTLTVDTTSTLTGAVTTGGALTTGTTLTVGSAATVTTNLTVDTNTLYVNATSDRVGIGSTTPFATLSVDTNAGDKAFIIGSSTATYLELNEIGDFIVDTDTLFVDNSTDRVGISTSTPYGDLGIGNGTASSTISAGRLCIEAAQEDGTVIYLYLGVGQANGAPWATSTTSCF